MLMLGHTIDFMKIKLFLHSKTNKQKYVMSFVAIGFVLVYLFYIYYRFSYHSPYVCPSRPPTLSPSNSPLVHLLDHQQECLANHHHNRQLWYHLQHRVMYHH